MANNKEKVALIFIEYQKEWLAPQGKLRRLLEDENLFNSALDKSAQLIELAREMKSVDIIHAGLKFRSDHRELGKSEYA